MVPNEESSMEEDVEFKIVNKLLDTKPGLSDFHENESVWYDDCNAGDTEETH